MNAKVKRAGTLYATSGAVWFLFIVGSIVTGFPCSDEDEAHFAAVQAGTRGYLLNGAAKSEMLRAIRDVAAGAQAILRARDAGLGC